MKATPSRNRKAIDAQIFSVCATQNQVDSSISMARTKNGHPCLKSGVTSDFRCLMGHVVQRGVSMAIACHFYPGQETQLKGREAGIQSPHHTKRKCAFGAASNTIDWLMYLLIDLSFPSRPLKIGVLRLSIGSIARPGRINHRDSPEVTIGQYK